MKAIHRLALCLVLAALVPAGLGLADERSTARRLEAARRDEPSLIAFLRAMPKGGDLHNHAGGAYFVEHGLREAVSRGLFFNPRTNRFEPTKSPENVPAARLLTDDALRYRWYNAASMRGPYSGAAGGHDHFFNAFGPAGSAWQKTGREIALAEIVRRARLQNLQYLELMAAPSVPSMGRILAAAQVPDTMEGRLTRLRPLLADYVREAKAQLDQWDRRVAELVGSTPPASGAAGPLTLRYLVTAYRTGPDEPIFATWAAAFALMQEDRRVVGVNFAAPEDHPIARENFDRHMAILDFLWRRFGQPNVTLHAGELNLTVSPVEDMTSHIRKSIEKGHAKRIGHGTAVAWEDDVHGLLRTMRERGIAVEVCPSSAEVILNKPADKYPFRLYRRAGVPLTINTDDEGVSRSNLTLEYVKAVQWWKLTYPELKELVRNSIQYSFLPGESLWEDGEYRRLRKPFRDLKEHGWKTTPEQEKALAASDKATVQLRLERAFAEFERD